MIVVCDVTNKEDVERAISRVMREHACIDVLINNAGIIQVGPARHMSLDDFETALATHFWGPVYAIRAAFPHMRRSGAKRIVNIASIGGKIAVPQLLPYSASKFALVGFSEGLRAELRREGFYVTTICPGLMRTGSSYNATFKGRHARRSRRLAPDHRGVPPRGSRAGHHIAGQAGGPGAGGGAGRRGRIVLDR